MPLAAGTRLGGAPHVASAADQCHDPRRRTCYAYEVAHDTFLLRHTDRGLASRKTRTLAAHAGV